MTSSWRAVTFRRTASNNELTPGLSGSKRLLRLPIGVQLAGAIYQGATSPRSIKLPLTSPLDFSDAYRRFLPPVRAKCRRLLGPSHAADDVAQEALIRLWKSGPLDADDPRSTMAWLYRTCSRLAIDVLRDRRRTDKDDSCLDTVPCTVDLAARSEARAAIAALAACVPEDELVAAVLCRVDGLSRTEAASVMEISERTVRRMLHRFDERIASLRKEVLS